MRKSSLLCVAILATAPMMSPASGPTLCALITNPSAYNRKVVRIRATYKYGYEWQALYCLDCLDRGRVWLEIPADLDRDSNKALHRAPAGSGTVNLTVEGIFSSGGTYGHLNGYRYKIVADKISDVAVLIRGMKSADEEKRLEEQLACGGKKPK